MRRTSRTARRDLVATGACLLVVSCTAVDVVPIDLNHYNKIAVRGDFCTTAPEEAKLPVRVLFATDSSDSMRFNDPTDQNVDAIEAAVARFRPFQNVSFGILRWGERIVRELVDYTAEPALFTKDETQLNAAFTRMRQSSAANPDKYLGGTDYNAALTAIHDYIVADIAQNPEQASTFRYYVEFMTDGMPQSGTVDPEVTRETILLEIAAQREDFDVRYDAVAIVEIATVAPEFFDLLPTMATTGGGSFIQLTTPNSLDDAFDRILANDLVMLEFDLATLSADETLNSVVVLNRSARVVSVDGTPAVFADSDADGLTDEEESRLGTNPADADTDGDGLFDLFEVSYFGEFDPRAQLSPALTDEELADEDGDGMIMFVEERVGLNDAIADLDEDGLADGLEYLLGTDPLLADMGADNDADGLANRFEILQGLPPHQAVDTSRLAELAYIRDEHEDPYAIELGRRCYDLGVSNITLASTFAATHDDGVHRPAGSNRIEVWRVEEPISGAASSSDSTLRRVVRATLWSVFDETGRRDPPGPELHLREVHYVR